MTKKISWALFAFFAILVGTIPFIILIKGEKFGIEASKDAALYSNLFWKFSFYTHIPFGGLSLLIGWTQFSSKLRAKYLNIHRIIGKIYVVSFLITSLAGLFIAFYATDGIISVLGFSCIAIIAFYTTFKAYQFIKKGDVVNHKKMMLYSYSCCFAAVTLRIWNPLLMLALDNPSLSYQISAWISWIPNLFVAYTLSKKKEMNTMNHPLSI